MSIKYVYEFLVSEHEDNKQLQQIHIPVLRYENFKYQSILLTELNWLKNKVSDVITEKKKA